MKYYSLAERESGLIAYDGSDAYDLGSTGQEITMFRELARAAAISGRNIDGIATQLCESAEAVSPTELQSAASRPFVPDEVWAAGVTYEISEKAREDESGMPEVYLDVYENDRPELFFKATASRTVGPNEPVGIRGDSDWNVPEPELGIVLYRGEIAGYTIGNDVSSRAIEGENPLYLPQAKVYNRCCSVGPCVTSAVDVEDPHDLTMTMDIERDGKQVFKGETSTGEMARSCEELVSYWARHNHVPEVAVLLTGTSLVPQEEFTLRSGDNVRIEIQKLGTLENTIMTV